MKVKELIEELERLDPDFKVRVISYKEREAAEVDGFAVFPKEKIIVIHGG